ncbi:hypothetical protein GOBAR_AA16577 [Gossypium barbadense]|uniref:Uncharacterized protein n=1 Tax=Gossypium barbadense TaxID=3634 RepID=A0A2P5XL75_GOSBA|nr:hypothetical protein GOBAR_AA16577 [Gossypium barbadense]
MGSPQADARSTQVPKHAEAARAESHDRGDDVSTGVSKARAWAAATTRVGIVHHLSGPDRHALTRTLLRRLRSIGGAPARDPANQFPCALRTDALSTQVPKHAETARAGSHNRGNDVSTGVSKFQAWATATTRVGPRPESIGGLALTIPHPTGAHRPPPSASLPTISSTL